MWDGRAYGQWSGTHDCRLTREVEGNTERCSQLIVAGVALADGSTRVVYTREDTSLAQLGCYVQGQQSDNTFWQ